ncbi:MAG: DUF6798 domain-containing protein [Gemmatimonadales bacterium]
MRRLLAVAGLLTVATAVESARSGEVLTNEALYLFAAWKWWRPEFLAGDWTYAVPWREHALFNATAGLLSLPLSLDVFKWVLRLAGWFAVYAGLLQLFRRIGIGWLAAVVAIVAWQVGGEALVGGEWVIGGAEAKVPAYAALFFALDQFIQRRWLAAGLLLGLCFSLHPAVGVGAGVGVAAALLVDRVPLGDLARAAMGTVLSSIPGLVASLGVSQGAGAGGQRDWELVVRSRLPHHLDPFTFRWWGLVQIVCFLVLLALIVWRWRPAREIRMIGGFLAGAALLFIAGVVARALEAWAVLQLYPFRILPLLLPCFVLAFLLDGVLRRDGPPGIRRAVAIATAAALLIHLGRGERLIRGSPVPLAPTVATRPPPDPRDALAVAHWVRENAPRDALVLGAPSSKRAFWDYRRAQVVNWRALRYDRMHEWRERMEALAGPLPVDRPLSNAQIEERFAALPVDSVLTLARRYGATLLVSRTVYRLPTRFSAGEVRVYQLPEP